MYSLTTIGPGGGTAGSLRITRPVGGRTAGFSAITGPVGARTAGFLTTATCFGLGQQHPVTRYAAMEATRRRRICLFMQQECHIQIATRLG